MVADDCNGISNEYNWFANKQLQMLRRKEKQIEYMS